MKLFIVSILAMSSITVASAATVSGLRAENLFTALQNAGAYVDGAAGTMGTQATQVQCLERGVAAEEQTYSCTLNAQDDTGSISPLNNVSNDASAVLLLALEDAGVSSDCGMGTCGVEVQSVTCLNKGEVNQKPTYSCDITQ